MGNGKTNSEKEKGQVNRKYGKRKTSKQDDQEKRSYVDEWKMENKKKNLEGKGRGKQNIHERKTSKQK